MAETYFTGRPCKRGHKAPRYKAQGLCTECAKENAARQRREHPEAKRESAKRNKATTREYMREYQPVWRAAHPGKTRLYHERYWAKHPEARKAETAAYRHGKRAARCLCCSSQDFRAVYKAAALLGKEVDHVMPLADGGTHCVKNLQLLTTAEHRQKSAAESRRRVRLVA